MAQVIPMNSFHILGLRLFSHVPTGHISPVPDSCLGPQSWPIWP